MPTKSRKPPKRYRGTLIELTESFPIVLFEEALGRLRAVIKRANQKTTVEIFLKIFSQDRVLRIPEVEEILKKDLNKNPLAANLTLSKTEQNTGISCEVQFTVNLRSGDDPTQAAEQSLAILLKALKPLGHKMRVIFNVMHTEEHLVGEEGKKQWVPESTLVALRFTAYWKQLGGMVTAQLP